MESGAGEVSATGRQLAADRTTFFRRTGPRLRAMIAGSSVPATPATTAPATPALATLPLTEIGASVGTPCYVYHAPTIRAAYQSLDSALGDYPHAVHYALKANSSLEIVRLLTALGASVDANSMG